jgi:bacillithiol system protein YtxJ
MPAYYLDLLEHRDISNSIATRVNVQHESPQLLILRNGVCTSHSSHNAIQPEMLGI